MRQHLRPWQPLTALLSIMRHGAERGTAKGKEREGQTATPGRTQTEPNQEGSRSQWVTTWPKLFGHRQRVYAPHTETEIACRMIAPVMPSTLTMQLRTAVSTATISSRRYCHRTRSCSTAYRWSYTKQGQPARPQQRSVRDVQSPSFRGAIGKGIVCHVQWRQRRSVTLNHTCGNTGKRNNPLIFSLFRICETRLLQGFADTENEQVE